jgi:hypothetical protein
MDKLVEFELDVVRRLENKETIPLDMFEKLDQMTFNMFKKLNVEYFPIDDIFLEIADELGIL